MSRRELLLPDLTIRGFRGLNELTIPHMGRVTLLTGRNGVGKTTVLEAIRILASYGRPSELRAILNTSDELRDTRNSKGGTRVVPDWPALFFGRRMTDTTELTIGHSSSQTQLVLFSSRLTEKELDLYYRETIPEEPIRAIRVSSDGIDSIVGLFPQEEWIPGGVRRLAQELPFPILCETLGPGIIKNADLARWWDKIALNPEEDRVREALSILTGREISGVVMIGKNTSPRSMVGGIRPMVKFRDEQTRVPLRSLGDGAIRLFSIVLALVNCRNGFLLLDEAENGLHYSVQKTLWTMVLQTAESHNVQVIATTHSYDCIRGFAYAANELSDIEGRLVRLSHKGGYLHTVDYPEAKLLVAAENSLELR